MKTTSTERYTPKEMLELLLNTTCLSLFDFADATGISIGQLRLVSEDKGKFGPEKAKKINAKFSQFSLDFLRSGLKDLAPGNEPAIEEQPESVNDRTSRILGSYQNDLEILKKERDILKQQLEFLRSQNQQLLNSISELSRCIRRESGIPVDHMGVAESELRALVGAAASGSASSTSIGSVRHGSSAGSATADTSGSIKTPDSSSHPSLK